MKNTFKILCLIIAICNMLNSTCIAQDSLKTNQKNGFRIYTSYFGTFASLPTGGLKNYVGTGGGLKYGSIFYFSNKGFSNGLINVGIKAEWINAELNLPNDYSTDSESGVSGAFAQNYGPVLTFNTVSALYIDLFYMPGWGFRMFSESYSDSYYDNENFSADCDVDPTIPHIRFSQAAGVSLRLYGFYAGFNIQNLANPNYDNGALLNNISTFQITLGVCGWKVRK